MVNEWIKELMPLIIWFIAVELWLIWITRKIWIKTFKMIYKDIFGGI